ncbi:MAG: trehalose-6-phosphate synthase [Acidimicrobiia bacterium]|nr:trehalose-6-phosphate synthase [Acidimicrobiia bacterium]
MVSALGPLLLRNEDPAVWVAAAIGAGDRAALRAGKARAPGIEVRLLDIDEHLHRLHYDIVSNSVLWFLHHGIFDLVRRPLFDPAFREAWDAYAAVNEVFAAAVCEAAHDGDVVLVQDYQLALVPSMVRRVRPDLQVLHFTHTPFCGPGGIRVLPDDVAAAICGSMGGGPSGFHTPRWAAAYRASVREVLGGGAASHSPFASSLGPDRAALEEVAASPAAAEARRSLDDLVGDRALIVRTDRVEPSKNLVRGFLAYDLLLKERADLRGRVVFVAMVYASRQRLAEYVEYANEVEEAVSTVNERWGTRDWQPIVLDDRDDFARSVAGLQRYDALLVNPLIDGLNLVAKEGPLLNERDGVLCLSRGAGAFDELGDAAREVHPYDLEQTARSLAAALDEPAAERAARARRLRELAGARTPVMWLDDLLGHAGS